MADKPLETYKFDVNENGRSMTVVIPKSDDKSYDKYLIEAETEKTREELRKQPAKTPPPVGSREGLQEVLREYSAYKKRRAEGGRKYF